MSILTQDLSKSGRLSPSARVNFAEYDKKKSHAGAWLIGIVAVLVALTAVGYFGVILRFQEVYHENLRLVDVQQELEDIQKRVKEADYDTIQKDYIKYSYVYLNDTEKNYADRKLILDKMESKIFSVGTITAFSLSGNQTSLTIYGMKMDEASYMMGDLLSDEDHMFKSVNVTQASGGKTSSRENAEEKTPVVNVTITFNTDDERAAIERQQSSLKNGGSNK